MSVPANPWPDIHKLMLLRLGVVPLSPEGEPLAGQALLDEENRLASELNKLLKQIQDRHRLIKDREPVQEDMPNEEKP